jgi:hypothetical protein
MSEAKTHVIDGVTYVEVKRKAEVGEKVLIIDNTSSGFKEGHIGTVTSFVFNYEAVVLDGKYAHFHEDYYVLVETGEEATVDQTQASPAVIDMLANLARRVTQLESQLRATQRNLETFAEQTESNTQDIAQLDERTQVINAIAKFYEEANR